MVFDSLENLLLTALGGFIFWLLSMLKDWVRTSTQERRTRTDRLARLDRENQKLREINYDLRNMMLQSGHFKREDLPPHS